jgi:hypothetical protein
MSNERLVNYLRAVEEEDDSPIRGRPELAVVDTTTGAQLEKCPGCEERDRIIEKGTNENEGLVETVRSQAAKMRELRKDREREMREHDLFPQVREAFEYWLVETGRTKRTKLDPKRFDLLEPFIKKDGLAMVKLAIDGAAYDPHRADRPGRNGKTETYDSLETIFKQRGSFERHVKRAPVERLRAVRDSGGFGEAYTDTDVRVKAEVILALEGAYELEGEALRMATAAAVERAKRELEGRGKA